MAEHARLLIEEMEDMHHNPLAAAIERMRNRTAGARLARRIGDGTLRQILTILGAMDDFPPAQILWNSTCLSTASSVLSTSPSSASCNSISKPASLKLPSNTAAPKKANQPVKKSPSKKTA
jgi:hypothetical protein